MEVPNIPEKYRYESIPSEGRKDVATLFTFFVRKMCLSGRASEYLMHNQIGNLIFHKHDSINLKRVVNEYKIYFEYNGRKKRLNLEKVYNEHPYIWTGEQPDNNVFSKDEIISAINDEIKETARVYANKYLKISEIKQITVQGAVFIYSAIVHIENDDYIAFAEGSQLRILTPSNSKIFVIVLDYKNKDSLIFFQSTKKIQFDVGKIQQSSLGLLYSLKDVVEATVPSDNPMWKLLYRKHNIPNIVKYADDIITNKLDLDSIQKQSIEKALRNDITYIWGPPGTGKSFTLARLLINLLNTNEKTIVCSIANVAVDGLLLKMIKVIDVYFKKSRIDLLTKSKIIRLGYSQSEKIREIPQIKLESQALVNISNQLQLVSDKISSINEEKSNSQDNKLRLISERDKLKREYELEIKKLISDSNMIFLTSSKFIVEKSLHSIEYDNLIIDEGSMMSIPHLLSLGSNAKRRIIISGDFQQLSPIALSKSYNAKKWLHKDLFSLLGKDENTIKKHPALIMLNQQRRSASEIAELINEPFYSNFLQTVPQLSHSYAKDIPPSEGHVSFIHLPSDDNNKATYSKNRSKYNSFSRKRVLQLLSEIFNADSKKNLSVGVICPYRQQVLDYKKSFEEKGFNKEQLTVGTIHTFQGSERDIIIWDIVDTKNQPIGILYRRKTGERLVNVSISRAKSKLIIVGDYRIFHECDGRDLVSHKVKSIVNKAWYLSVRQKNNR